jgi:hypothetical protein
MWGLHFLCFVEFCLVCVEIAERESLVTFRWEHFVPAGSTKAQVPQGARL